MTDFITVTFTVATFASGVRFAIPYLLAALGETLGQRSGVLNLGVDGVMLLGAFFAYWAVLNTDSITLGLLMGIGVGLVMGAVYATVTVVFRAEQGISGIGIFLFGLGINNLLFYEWVGTSLPISGFDKVAIPLLSDIPKIGDMFFNHNLLVYVSMLLVPGLTLLINRTTFGLNVRAVGETPEAADSLGVSVARTRTIAILVANGLAGLAGAALAIELATFQNNITNQIGFIAIALVYFGAWRPFGVLAGSMLYGLITATVTRWTTLGLVTGDVASFTKMAPAALTIFALVLIARRAADQPAALTLPFVRGH